MIYTILLYLLMQTPNPVHLALLVQVTNGEAGGSGTIFQVCGRDTLILTCGHMFSRTGNGPITITRQDGTQHPGTLRAVLREIDLAAVVIATPDDAADLYAAMNGGKRAPNWELVISKVIPREVLALGLGMGQIALHRGNFIQSVSLGDEYTITPRSGDSGGPAWDPQTGEFAGIIVWVDAAGQSGGIIGPAAVRQFYQTYHLGKRRRAA